jgi:hypothetical protein
MLIQHQLSFASARRELAVLSKYINDHDFFGERDIVRVLKASPNLTVLIGTLARGMILADAFKYEFRIQGVVSADLILRSRGRDRVVLVEFEGGRPGSIFSRRASNQLREWSREIEHATGQIIDWSWALADVAKSKVLASNLGVETLDVQYLVICGRDAALDSELLRQRFTYRHSRLNIAGSSVVFLTYDGFLREVSHALTEFRTEGVP